MKGVILRKGERAYSYFSGVFSVIFPAVVERNWLITGYENYPEALEPYGGKLGREAFFWVPGERLEEIVRQQDYPWYWGVLSGFKREVPLHQVLSYGLPYADGYTGFWKNPISIQHPMADIEIVAWARRTSPEHLRYAACYRAASGADNPRYGKKYIDVCGLIVFAAGVIAAVQAGTVFLFRAVFIQHLIDGFLSVMRHWRYLHISVKSRKKWNKYCILNKKYAENLVRSRFSAYDSWR